VAAFPERLCHRTKATAHRGHREQRPVPSASPVRTGHMVDTSGMCFSRPRTAKSTWQCSPGRVGDGNWMSGHIA
jgi:hypothetical protein